jgi:23S rRNA pseudouridine1911/1915/1917 synthase
LSRDELRQHVVSETKAKAGPSEVREAITHYEVIAEYPLADGRGFVTKLRLRLETGPKHQIRVQAAHAGLPLIGDRTYNPAYRGGPRRFNPPIEFPRQACTPKSSHSNTRTGPEAHDLEAELPKDLRQLEAILRASRRLKS